MQTFSNCGILFFKFEGIDVFNEVPKVSFKLFLERTSSIMLDHEIEGKEWEDRVFSLLIWIKKKIVKKRSPVRSQSQFDNAIIYILHVSILNFIMEFSYIDIVFTALVEWVVIQLSLKGMLIVGNEISWCRIFDIYLYVFFYVFLLSFFINNRIIIIPMLRLAINISDNFTIIFYSTLFFFLKFGIFCTIRNSSQWVWKVSLYCDIYLTIKHSWYCALFVRINTKHKGIQWNMITS